MTFHKVCTTAEVPPGEARRFVLDGVAVAVFHLEDGWYAIHDTCTHARASLSEGWVFGDLVACPLHGARFNVKTGAAVTLPATKPVERFEVRLQGDTVLVGVDPDAVRRTPASEEDD